MAYKYFEASNKIYLNPKGEMRRHYQEVVNESFKEAVDWFTIEEELPNEKGQYQFVDVRLNSAIANETGTKLGDDFRKIIFQDVDHARGLGYKYRIDDSIWLTINYDIYGKLTASSLVRKCRNVMKWIDPDSGAILEEPVVFDNYQLKEASPFYNAQITIPTGFVPVVVQNNARTSKINLNQRFYFNQICYKVQSIFSPLSTPTYEDAPIIYMILNIDETNKQRDDVSLGIANIFDYDYKLNITTDDIEQKIGYKGTVGAQILLNGTNVSRDVQWFSNSPQIASINGLGEYELLSLGETSFVAMLSGNANVFDTVKVTVTDNPTEIEQTLLLPEQRYILQGDTIQYSLYRYINGTEQPDTFDFEFLNVPDKHYTITFINGNHIVIKNNLRYTKNKLLVRATSRVTQEVFEFDIELKGGF